MSDILKRIADTKRVELAALKSIFTPESLAETVNRACLRHTLSLSKSILATPGGIIAEHKRRSPSAGEIAPMSQVADIAGAYERAGAAGISVLTDTPHFGGSLTDLAVARKAARTTPLLRKEFIVDRYQIHQARLYGADAILLIAALLSPDEVNDLTDEAHRLNLEVLLELHTESEATDYPVDRVDMVGVNNRNLHNFETSLDASIALASLLPANIVTIAESGIKTVDDILTLRQAGFDGFLIGQSFMSHTAPGERLKEWIDAIV